MSHRSKPKWVPRCLEGGQEDRQPARHGRRASRAPSATSTGWKPVCHDSRAGLSFRSGALLSAPCRPTRAAARFLSAPSAIGLPSRAERTTHPLPVDCARGWVFKSLQSPVSLERCALRLVATQPRGDQNGKLPHRHFKLGTICRGSAVLVRKSRCGLREALRKMEKQPTSN